MYNFPDAPTVGLTTTTPDGVTYAWDGQKWTASSSSIPVPLTVPLGGTSAIDLPVPPHAPTTGMIGSLLFGTGATPVFAHPSAGYWDAGGIGIGSAGSGTAYLDLATASGTPAAPAALAAGQPLGELSFSGHDGTAWAYGNATVSPVAAEAWTATAHGTNLTLWATTQGTTQAMPRLSVDGNLPYPGTVFFAGSADNRPVGSIYGDATLTEFDVWASVTAGMSLATLAGSGATIGWYDLAPPAPPALPGQLNFSVAGAQPTYFDLVCEMTVDTVQIYKYLTIVNEASGYAGVEIIAKDDFAWVDFFRFNTLTGLPVGVSSGDVLGVMMSSGFDNTAGAYGSASMEFNASENWAAATHGTEISFWNTINGTPGPRERLRIGASPVDAAFYLCAGVGTNRLMSTIWGSDTYAEIDAWGALPDATYPIGSGTGLWASPTANNLGAWGMPLNLVGSGTGAGMTINMTLDATSTKVHTALDVASGIINLGPANTAQIGHTPGLGVTFAVGGTFGFYVGSALGTSAWIWVNDGGVANATGTYHGKGSMGSHLTGGGPLYYSDIDQSIWHLGGGVGAGGISDKPTYHWKDVSTNELMSLDHTGWLALWCYSVASLGTRSHMDLYAADNWSEIDMYANLTGHAMLIMANYGNGTAPYNGILSWDFSGAGLHAPIWFMRGFATKPLSLDATSFTTDQGNAVKPGGGGWVAPSDIRMKKAVADYTTGLAALRQLRPVTYQYNGSYGIPDDGRTYTGLVADEAELIMPEMVGTEERIANPGAYLVERTPTDDDRRRVMPNPLHETMAKDTVKTLDFTALTFALINALKEVADRLDALEAGTTAMAAAPVRPRNGNRTARPRH